MCRGRATTTAATPPASAPAMVMPWRIVGAAVIAERRAALRDAARFVVPLRVPVPASVPLTAVVAAIVPVAAIVSVVRLARDLRVLPALDEIRRVAEDVQPGHAVGERRAMRQAAGDARRQRRVGEARHRLQQLPQPLEIAPRHRQDAEVELLTARIGPRRAEPGRALQYAERLEEGADQDGVGELGGR